MPTTQAYIGPAVWVDGTDGPAEELHSLAKKIQDRHLGAIQTDTGNSKEKGGGQQSTLLQVFEARLRQLDAMIDAVAAAETRLRSAATAVHAAAKKDVVHVPGGAPGLLRGTGAGA
ncbi:unnamed protein product [Pedinophyceae sp. YPF-701]|nr:unnamed protein product [Pedinophyceae sp. YPF-701]